MEGRGNGKETDHVVGPQRFTDFRSLRATWKPEGTIAKQPTHALFDGHHSAFTFS
jgi:hypothetical protein